jgi:exonuclease III
MQDNIVDLSVDDLNSDPRYSMHTRALYGNVFSDLVTDFDIPDCQFYNEIQVINKLKTMNDYLSIFSLNCRSIFSNQGHVGDLIDSFNRNEGAYISILTLQELWCNVTQLNFPGYKYFSKCRSNTRGSGGGVGLLIKDSFQTEILENNYFLAHIHESLTARVSINNFKFLVISLYRPPDNSRTAIRQFFEMFNDFLDYLSDLGLPVFLTGDLNLNFF